MKILTVVGARPNFMKAAPIIAAINEHNRRLLADTVYWPEPQAETVRHILVHTGQHYVEVMSGSFFSDLNLPKPDIHRGTNTIAGTRTDTIKDAIRRQLGRKKTTACQRTGTDRPVRIIDILARWRYAKAPSRPSFNPLAVPPQDRCPCPQPN